MTDDVATTKDSTPPVVEGSVAIMYLTRGEVRFEFSQSLIALMQQKSALEVTYILGQIGSGNLAVHRNEVVAKFLTETPAEFLLLLDDDMQFPTDIIDKLYDVLDNTGLRIVGGLYGNIGTDGGMIPMAYHLHENNRLEPYSATAIGQLINKGGKSVKVWSTGAGCLLIHRSLLEDMVERYGWPMPCFDNPIVPDASGHPVVQGEDHGFFRRLIEMEEEVQVCIDVDLSHFKVMAISRQMFIDAGEKATNPLFELPTSQEEETP